VCIHKIIIYTIYIHPHGFVIVDVYCTQIHNNTQISINSIFSITKSIISILSILNVHVLFFWDLFSIEWKKYFLHYFLNFFNDKKINLYLFIYVYDLNKLCVQNISIQYLQKWKKCSEKYFIIKIFFFVIVIN
jgi:hypothetical protein